MKFYAKSTPLETIQEHTDNLIKNFYILKEAYPNININWDLLKEACIYHDLGKINLKFQKKILYGKRDKTEIAHNLLSLAFLNTNLLKEKYNINEIKILAHAIAYHHERGDYEKESYDLELEEIKKIIEKFKYEKVELTRIKAISPKYFKKDRIYEEDKNFYKYVLIKGLLNRLDYAASSYIKVEEENNFLEKALEKLLENWKKDNSDSNWNNLQEFMRKNRNENIIAVAQTGMGKTEAGLLWIGNNKGFFILPLKTAINEIYKRIKNNIVNNYKIGLLHSDTFSKYMEYENEDEMDIQKYYNKTRQLSLGLTICTLDQLFNFVYKYKDFELKLATLSYSKIVIDEIQMYSPDLVAYIIVGIKMITEVGGKFSILTATFPKFIGDLLKKEKINFKESSQAFIDKKIRHSAKILEEDLNTDEILKKNLNQKILIICNTVKKAQKIYNELLESKKIQKNKINLIHSKFIKKDRNKKEREIMKLGDVKNNENGIWIGTQILEASLDIDFDLLFTELSDINGLFQRFGRCYRKREIKENNYNCFVYVGKTKPCSGIRNNEKSVIDYDIFNLSKKLLLEENIKGKLSEEKKLELVDKVYSTESLKDTKYYRKILEVIKYLNCINAYELNKKEVKKRFRDINTFLVIPYPVYKENYKKIKELEKIINTKNEKGLEGKKEKFKKREEIKSYTLNISYAEGNKRILSEETIDLGNFEKIYILDCNYDLDVGVTLNQIKEKETNFDSMFV